MMQCQMKFFEVLPKGVGQGVQKVAVKMPAQGDTGSGSENNGFADIMAALMSMPAEQLRQSLAQLDRVCVEGQGKEWVPLLDLTQSAGTNGSMLKLLKIEPQSNNAAASMLQLKLLQQQGKETTGPVENGSTGEAAPFGAQGMPPEDTAIAADVREELAAVFTKGQAESDGATKKEPTGDASAELARALTGQAAKTESRNQRATDLMQDLKVDAKADGKIQPESHPELPAIAQELQGEGAEALAAMEKKAAAPRHHTATPKASPAAVSHVAAPSMVTETVDMQASLDTALSQQRPIKKEEGGIVDERALGQEDNPVTMATPQSTSTAKESLPAVESRLGGVEARSVAHSKENGETAAASREMQTDVIHQIVQRMTVRSDGRNSSMQIKLKPEFLGNLHMEVVAENHQVTVRVTAENQMVKGIIEQNLHVLKNELQHHGLQIQKFDVFVSQDNDAWRNGQQQSAFRQAQDRGYRSGNGRSGRFTESEEIGAVTGSAAVARNNGEQSSVDFFA